MICDSCPFSLKPQAEMALNLSCLPEPHEIMKIKKETNKNWTWHHDETKICKDFIEQCKENNIDYSIEKLISFEKWYYTGET